MPIEPDPTYLAPYQAAARVHGGGFGSLLWASEATQAARFAAILRLESPTGQSVLDVGCGRADFLDFCIARNLVPNDYVGIEAVDALADAAELKDHVNCRITRADFVTNPGSMFVVADLVVFSGSLNTLDDDAFYATIRRAVDATARTVVFNFLSSPNLAAAKYLHWRRPLEVVNFCRKLSDDLRFTSGYLEGDYTIAINK
jgi:SAM-dependent methyltransferase